MFKWFKRKNQKLIQVHKLGVSRWISHEEFVREHLNEQKEKLYGCKPGQACLPSMFGTIR
jgi:hypothetical protein